ncbi:MAG: THUMP domain-containing class I SAM-dependent RNA methyltransferase [Candidatus Howiella sp.]
MIKLQFAAPCLFGVEGILAEELRRLGAEEVLAENGRVLFSGGEEMVARANICSRYAERILILLGRFTARTFTELFDQVKALPFEDFIGREDAFPVKGWTLESALHSLPDCQSIIKKAIVERLKTVYRTDWFQETGAKLSIQFSIHKDEVSVMLDTSGAGLHKRGYRRNAADAPLKETLAAAMAYVTRLYPDTQLYDPFCGSGTILIESAMLALGIAPGRNRTFAAEKFGCFDAGIWREERARALSPTAGNEGFMAFGSDIDPAAVTLTLENAKKAGVQSFVQAKTADIADFVLPEGRACVITNPPYGERLLSPEAAAGLVRTMGQKMPREAGKRYSIISPDEEFERRFGRPADKRRKLYNGMIKCQLYMYFRK